MRAVAVIAGTVLILLVVSDAISTLIVTQGRTAAWRPTRIWYHYTWLMTRAFALRAPSKASDVALDSYPALSLLGLLTVWLAGLVVGWGLVYFGLDLRVQGSNGWGTLVYYAGTSLLTPSFGTVHATLPRILTLIEVVTGLGTIALLISYLPTLYGAYSRREARLLTLDDPAGGRITPVRVVAVHAGDGDVDLLYRFFADWEMWTAEVLESHVSYPMLAVFRSQHIGQSWVTALGVVTDAATLVTACVAGAENREPYLLHRRGRRAVVTIADRLHIKEQEAGPSWLTYDNFEIAWNGLNELGLPLRDREEAWLRLQDLRRPYGARLQQLIDYLLAPHGFWGHSAEATLESEVSDAAAEARARVQSWRRS